MPSLGYGGAEKITLRLINGLIEQDVKIDLIIATPNMKLSREIHPEVNLINFGSKKATFSLFKLINYIKKENPEIILSHLSRANRLVLLAKYLTGNPVKVYVVEHTTRSAAKKGDSLLSNKVIALSYKYLYRYAEEVIHVSNGSARDLEQFLNWETGRVKVAYNPVIDPNMIKNNYETPHPWFELTQSPVIVSVGRLGKPKDYFTLVKAIKKVRENLDVRLLILGDGGQRMAIENLIDELGLADFIRILGFIDDPFPYLFHADLFVLSSLWEALPTVIIEALACGCKIVSSDCPHGPSEILEDGKHGTLVEPGNVSSLADGIITELNSNRNSNTLRERAHNFNINSTTRNYMEILQLMS